MVYDLKQPRVGLGCFTSTCVNQGGGLGFIPRAVSVTFEVSDGVIREGIQGDSGKQQVNGEVLEL